MKKIVSRCALLQALYTTIIPLLLFSAMVGVQFVRSAAANPFSLYPPEPDTNPPTISILSPGNRTYAVNNISLAFTVSETTSWIGYCLDRQANVTIIGNTTLIGLPDGTYSLIVYARDIAGNRGSSHMIYFTIDTTPPSILILSPENKTYETTDIPLAFTIDESVSWITYSLDGQSNVTITGNTTLTDLSDGSHTLTFYAKDTAGNTGASETVYFSKAQQSGFLGSSLPMEYGYAIVAVAGVAIAAVTGNLFFKRLRRQKQDVPTLGIDGE